MKVRNKLMTAFIIPILLLGLLSIILQFWNNSLFRNSIEVNATKVEVVNRMEYLEAEASRNALRYILLLIPTERTLFENNFSMLQKHLRQYEQLPLTNEEKSYLSTTERIINQIGSVERSLFDLTDQRIRNLQEGRDLLYNKIQPILNTEWKQVQSTDDKSFQAKNNALLTLHLDINRLLSTSRAYMLYSAPALKKLIGEINQSINADFQKLSSLNLSSQELALFNTLQSNINRLMTLANSNIPLEDKKLALMQQDRELGLTLKGLLHEKLEASADKQLAANTTTIKRLNYIFLFLLSFLIIFSLLLSWLFSSFLTRPVAVLKKAIDRIRKGEEVNIQRSTRDELGDVTEVFGEMIKENKIRTAAINEQNWLKQSINEILKAAQIETNLESMCNTVISKIGTLLGAGCGAFYVVDEKNADRLVLIGSYAYSKRKKLSNNFKFGEGIIGQAALEGKPILLTDIPEDYIHITSGLGDKNPTSILVYPVKLEQKTLGAIEIASFKHISDIEQQFLEQLSSNLAVIIEAIQSRQQTEEALSQVQKQAEELQTQQEELRTSNEELEEKTLDLQQSEEELKTQSEELQSTNVELEEKMQAIEVQKQEIERKNKALHIAQKELEEKARSLTMAGKYKTEFLSNMSHELRTPLNSLLLLAKSFAKNDDGNLTAEQIEQANIIYKGGKDLLELINDILDLSKVEAGKLDIQIETTDIKNIIDDLKREFEQIVENKGIKFEIHKETSLTNLKTDGHRLKQVLRNLISNAVKFTEKGYVKLIIADADDNIKLPNNENKLVAFKVIDSGIGIEKEKHKEIFEAFQQAYGNTDRIYGGTGLGLTISRELARLLGGEIKIESELGKGSTFTLILPTEIDSTESQSKPKLESKNATMQQPPEKKASDTVEVEGPTKSPKQIILIAANDTQLAQSLASIIQRKGYKYLSATSTEEAFEMTKNYLPNGIIIEESLINNDADGIFQQLKTQDKTKDIPIHVISDKDNYDFPQNESSVFFFQKPMKSDDLDQIVEFFSQNNSKVKELNLLLIEDDLVTQKSIKQSLESKDISVDCVLTGKAAIKKLSSSNNINGVILDLKLPDMDGLTILKTLESLEIESPPIIVYSAKDLTKEEYEELNKYTHQIVRKEGKDSLGRLLQECTLFIHSVADKKDKATPHQIPHHIVEPDKILNEKQVLLVDDDMRNVYALSRVLQKAGMKVIAASNGQEAIDKLATNSKLDIVIMDIMMPVMDGYQAMKNIRKDLRYKDLPIIAVTAKAMADDKKSCLDAGANDYITKPIDDEKLLSLMRVWLSK